MIFERLLFLVFLLLYFALMYCIVMGELAESSAILALSAMIFFFSKKDRLLFVIVFISGFLFLLAGEVYFRIDYFGTEGIRYFTRYSPADLGNPFSGLEYDENTYTNLKPRQSGFLKGGQFYVNSLGFRDKERSLAKTTDGVVRVVVCGTSISMGAGVDQKEIYAGYLEQTLNKLNGGQRFEVINLSRGGYGVDDMIDVLEKYGIRFEPDFIIIEDGFWNKKGLHPIPIKPNGYTLYEKLIILLKDPSYVSFFIRAIRNEFIQNLKTKLEQLKRRLDRIADITFRKPALATLDESTLSEVHEVNGSIEGYFRRIKHIAANSEVYILSLRPMRNLHMRCSSNELVVELSSKYGFDYIDTSQEDYGLNAKDMIIYPGDRHPNRRAHRIYANVIYRHIVDALI